MSDEKAKKVTVSIETARLIRTVFLPHNPNKMRKADPRVLAAVWDFIDALDFAEDES